MRHLVRFEDPATRAWRVVVVRGAANEAHARVVAMRAAGCAVAATALPIAGDVELVGCTEVDA